jgi:hypothetical protein
LGYKSKLKMVRKLIGGSPRPHSLNDMIECPVCHAWSYPRRIMDPVNDTEKEAIICGSCRIDLMPIIKARKEAAEMKNSLKEGVSDKPQEAPVEIGVEEEVGKIHHVSFESEEERQNELKRLNARRDAYLEKHPETEGEQDEVGSTGIKD